MHGKDGQTADRVQTLNAASMEGHIIMQGKGHKKSRGVCCEVCKHETVFEFSANIDRSILESVMLTERNRRRISGRAVASSGL